MKDSRLRQPIEDDYSHALGVATFKSDRLLAIMISMTASHSPMLMRPLFTTVILVGLFPLLITWHLQASDLYVSPNGDDTGTGAIHSPLETIQEGVNRALAGDTIFLRAGSYHETVNFMGKYGTSGAPISVTSYNGEAVILDGRIAIGSSWTQHSGKIYKADVDEEIWQLWVDEEPMTLARWPNSQEWTDEFWNQSTSWAWTDVDNSAHNGWIEDAALTSVDTSLTGCVMVMNSDRWRSRASVVDSHIPGTDTFTYSPMLPNYSHFTTKAYFLTGLPVLDSSREWFYQAGTKTLFLWADDGLDPTGRRIMGKNQSYFMDGGRDASHLTFDGLTFVGTTVRFRDCPHISLVNCDFLYPVYSKRTLGSYTDAIYTDLENCDHLKVINCTFQYSDGRPLVAVRSDYPVVENNLFFQTDYACLAGGSNSYTCLLYTSPSPRDRG